MLTIEALGTCHMVIKTGALNMVLEGGRSTVDGYYSLKLELRKEEGSRRLTKQLDREDLYELWRGT